MAQFFRPIGPDTQTGWTIVGETTIWGAIDDVTSDGTTTYVYASGSSFTTLQISLSSGYEPDTGTQTLRIVWLSSGGSGAPEKIDITFRSNTTTIFTDTVTLNRGSFVTYTHELSAAEIALITDWTALALDFAVNNLGNNESVMITQVEFETPDPLPIDFTGTSNGTSTAELTVFDDSNWYNTSWSSRVMVRTNPDLVEANITGFYYFLPLQLLPDSFFSGVKSDGSDIRVTQFDGETEVPVYVAAIDTSAKTGGIFFKHDTNITSPQVYWVYFGNASASAYADNATYGRYNVFNGVSNITDLWIFNETPSATTGSVKSSVSGGMDGRYVNATGSETGSGPLPGVPAFTFDDAAPGYFSTTSSTTIDLDETLSWWMKVDDYSGGPYNILGCWALTSAYWNVYFNISTIGWLTIAVRSGGATTSRSLYQMSTTDYDWHRWDLRIPADGQNLILFRDGVIVSNTQDIGTPDQNAWSFTAGGGTYTELDGSMAMVQRLSSSGVLGTTQVQTYYNNQNPTDSLLFWDVSVVDTTIVYTDVTLASAGTSTATMTSSAITYVDVNLAAAGTSTATIISAPIHNVTLLAAGTSTATMISYDDGFLPQIIMM